MKGSVPSLSPWLVDGCLLPMSSHCLHSVHMFVQISPSSKAWNKLLLKIPITFLTAFFNNCSSGFLNFLQYSSSNDKARSVSFFLTGILGSFHCHRIQDLFSGLSLIQLDWGQEPGNCCKPLHCSVLKSRLSLLCQIKKVMMYFFHN